MQSIRCNSGWDHVMYVSLNSWDDQFTACASAPDASAGSSLAASIYEIGAE
jgi:hypothetical protein